MGLSNRFLAFLLLESKQRNQKKDCKLHRGRRKRTAEMQFDEARGHSDRIPGVIENKHRLDKQIHRFTIEKLSALAEKLISSC
jgi:hypothetical protein